MAVNLGAKNLFGFREQTWEEVLSALEKLAGQKSVLLKQNIPGVEKMYNYIDPIYDLARFDNKDEMIDRLDKNSISYLSVPLIKEFLINPNNQEVRDALSIQLGFVAAATNNLGEFTPMPYAAEEIKDALQGTLPYYSDLTFIHTLRQQITDKLYSEDLPTVLLNTFPSVADKEGKEEILFWDNHFINALMLAVIWMGFPLLETSNQKFLIQNYLYYSIVAGVPVRSFLKQILLAVAEADDEESHIGIVMFFTKTFEFNEESVPLDVLGEETMKLTDIFHNYLAAVYEEKVNTLAQEKFLMEFYKGEAKGGSYRRWLREIFTLLIQLPQPDFILL